MTNMNQLPSKVTLRDYQREAVARTLIYLKNNKGNPLVVAPTGSGKSLMIAHLCEELEANSKLFFSGNRPLFKILILAHRKELLSQNASQIKMLNPSLNVSFYSNAIGTKDLSGDIVVAGIASLSRVPLESLPRFNYIIIDEAHLVNNINSGMYRNLLNELRSARVIGFSATPFRLKGGFLYKCKQSIFNDVSYEIPVVKLMERGFLAPLKSKSSEHAIDTSNLKVQAGEFVQSEYDKILNEEELIKETVKDILAYSRGRDSWLIFCSSVDHSLAVRDELIAQGIKAATITGKTDPHERDRIIKLFKAKRIKAITNCDVLTVGFDAPNVDLIAILRPTKSCGLYIQIVGRGTRLAPSKTDCLILDYGGNIERFGPIDKIRLKQNSFGKVQSDTLNLKVCPACREVINLKLSQCPSCDYTFPKKEVDRTLKHSHHASNFNILKTDLMRAKFDGKQVLQVYEHKLSVHYKDKKPPSIKVDYYISKFDKVSEWVCVEHPGFAKMKARDWWKNHASGIPFPNSCSELLLVKDSLRLPDKIVVRIEGDYPVITNRYFKEQPPKVNNYYFGGLNVERLSTASPKS